MKNNKLRLALKLHILIKNKIFLILILIILPTICCCQVNDSNLTDKDKNYVKMIVCSNILLNTSYVYPSDINYLYENFYNIYKIDTLKSKGFKNVYFYKISLEISKDSLIELYKSVKSGNSNFYIKELFLNDNEVFLSNKEYIIAKIGVFYKLQGFYKNDLYNFFAICYNTNDYFTEEVIKKRNSIGIRKMKKQTHQIIKMLEVEGMDLKSELLKVFH